MTQTNNFDSINSVFNFITSLNIHRMEFYFVKNCEAPIYREFANPVLTEFGIAQAKHLAKFLRKSINNHREVQMFNYSTKACIETSSIIGREFQKRSSIIYDHYQPNYNWLLSWLSEQIEKATFVTTIFVVDAETVRYFPQEKLGKNRNHEFGFFLNPHQYKEFKFEY